MNENDPTLTIGVFARRSRLSVKALRLYESRGVLRPDAVDTSTGYRRYRESQLRDARLVRLLRRLDMPMVEVAAILSAPRHARAELVRQHALAAAERARHQSNLAELLQSVMSGGKDTYPMYTISTREVPEQTVLTEQRNVTADALPGFIADAGGRQLAALTTAGGPFGSSMVIYHGDVTEDSDGPVEVCSPIPAGVAETVSLPSRVDPSHREAFTRITKAQVRFPDVLSAYDAVESWIARNGERVAGPPREVYFADLMQADDGAEVADIAFPIASK
ncbi:DNA-binding transcriptional MerR regulator [Glaciihabitans tibetensis]|uniref:DNA-binding transcriptional MerR regulator n=1 Tax=Glaciihabitans tibetensis TaxID=1266600 RepID=A0A2T0VDR8_9MICO|nr:MerR family transcriptional regulator [Glaciihabitans tibetensis]PRY68315.1 DNA-binding transcriptional MerR regulator [Glaciihabitans tibetensis]